jgi:uncharacterized UPF0160 family protein
VEEIDAIDNGISTHDGEGRYSINTNLSRRVGNLSPRWNDPEQASTLHKHNLEEKIITFVIKKFLR